MSWTDRVWRWLIADPEQSTLYDAIDQELSRQDPTRLDTRDGIFSPPCWARHESGWICGLYAHHLGDHLGEDHDHNIMAVWPREDAWR